MQIGNHKEVNLDGSKYKIAILLPFFNEKIGHKLATSAKKELIRHKVKEKNIELIRVGGALELPFAAMKISKKFDGILALGVVIRGETDHYNMVCKETYSGLMRTQLETKVPIGFGVLTCKNEKQAEKRVDSKGKHTAQSLLIQINL